ncbi:uncharacterized protein LOC134223141 [Armigeres subalbatus]|uniref:uncharacterized protein LOC134223141 n=1 Tax=Armigeres subalbatus TaxID=124917 RepID=UPI002ED3385D
MLPAQVMGTYKLRQYKSNPDLVARRAVENNRFDRIPSPPINNPEMLLMRRKLESHSARMRRFDNECLYGRPRSADKKIGITKQEERGEGSNETEEIRQLCKGFGQQMSLLK